jgi:hypothetical protein
LEVLFVTLARASVELRPFDDHTPSRKHGALQWLPSSRLAHLPR